MLLLIVGLRLSIAAQARPATASGQRAMISLFRWEIPLFRGERDGERILYISEISEKYSNSLGKRRQKKKNFPVNAR
jgi:hypothetical protein